MLNLNDFILLKAIFNEQLHNAVLDEDADKILGIVNKRYQFELQNGFVQQEDLNVELLQRKHLEQVNDPDTVKNMI